MKKLEMNEMENLQGGDLGSWECIFAMAEYGHAAMEFSHNASAWNAFSFFKAAYNMNHVC